MASNWYANWMRSKLPEPLDCNTKEKRRKAYMHDYCIRNKDKKREYDRQRYLDGRKRTPRKPEHEYKSCELCGAPYYPYHFSDKYCSKSCRERVMSKRKYERRKVDIR